MCDFGKPHAHGAKDFGFLVDVPEVRALVDETRRLTAEISDTAARVDALRPAFGKLLTSDNWLPKEYAEPDLKSGMGSGIGQYALYFVKTASDVPSVSIHLLANDTACVTRHRFDATSGSVTPFRSGYSNAKCLNDLATS